MILVLKLFSRRIVEEPKAFVGESATLKKERDQTEEKPRMLGELAHKSRPAGRLAAKEHSREKVKSER